MSLFDNLNNLAKNVGEKANETIEIAKLNKRISSEKVLIKEDMEKIGRYFYEKYKSGQMVDNGISGTLSSIDVHYSIIKETEEQIARINNSI